MLYSRRQIRCQAPHSKNSAFLFYKYLLTFQNSPGHLLGANHHVQHPTAALALGADKPQPLDGCLVGWRLVAHHRRHPTEGVMLLVGALAVIFRGEDQACYVCVHAGLGYILRLPPPVCPPVLPCGWTRSPLARVSGATV